MTTLETTTTAPRTTPGAFRPNERLSPGECEPLNPSECASYSPEPSIPTMLVPRELSYLYWLASKAEGRGRVIDLGAFLGGSTVPLAQGILASDSPRQKLLSYDAFESPEVTTPQFVRLLAGYGLTPGHCFYDRFLANIGAVGGGIAECVVARKGWLPPNADQQQRLALYPEQEPIELLFVDIAKTWDVNLSVISTFFPHLVPGAVVVHQDFFDLQTPWIPLHMWQLRNVLEPLDVIYGTPSVSFRCVGSPEPLLDMLWSDPSDSPFDAGVWDEVIAYWAGLIGEEAAGFLHGHACNLALMLAQHDAALEHGRAFEQWSRSKHSSHVYFSPSWPDLLKSIPSRLTSEGKKHRGLLSLAAESVARGSRLNRPRPGDLMNFYPIPLRREIWEGALIRLQRDHADKRVYLYGAGKHTKWLLDAFGDRLTPLVAGILDDEPAADELNGLPVIALADCAPAPGVPMIVLPSSDMYESPMLRKLHDRFRDSDSVTIERVYTQPGATPSVWGDGEYTPAPPAQDGRQIPEPLHTADEVSPSAPHRPRLGLPENRGWTGELAACYAPPSWSTGYPALPEAEFLWDMIESQRPRTVVEIGTASGVSTAVLLHAMDRFCAKDARIWSYDISSMCYFDATRRVGAAAGEMAPHLMDRARLFSNADAIDAASRMGVGEVDLAFIDANHRHPAPTLDLLALVYAIRPGAWVILHDIELPNLVDAAGERPWSDASGAQLLYERWPFDRVRLLSDHPNYRNIGAIRMPDTPTDAVDACLDLLQLEWETPLVIDPDLPALLSARQLGQQN